MFTTSLFNVNLYQGKCQELITLHWNASNCFSPFKWTPVYLQYIYYISSKYNHQLILLFKKDSFPLKELSSAYVEIF